MMIDKSTQQALWVAGTIAGVSMLTYYLFRNSKKPIAKREVPQTPPPERIHTEPTEPKVSKSTRLQKIKPETKKTQPEEHQIFPLQKGSSGKEVERLQIWLLRNHGWKGTVTGIYDTQTETLVKKSLKRDTVDKILYEKHQMGIPIHQQIQL
jgi:hypothetical protein